MDKCPLGVELLQLMEVVHGMVSSRNVADAQQYFKSFFLNFGGTRIMELTPENYLIASVSKH